MRAPTYQISKTRTILLISKTKWNKMHEIVNKTNIKNLTIYINIKKEIDELTYVKTWNGASKERMNSPISAATVESNKKW